MNELDALKLKVIQQVLTTESKNKLQTVQELLETGAQKSEKAYSVEDRRKKHSNAYMPWSPEDDEYLEQLYCEKLTVKQLSVALGRNAGAIRSRIAKLELAEKYGG